MTLGEFVILVFLAVVALFTWLFTLWDRTRLGNRGQANIRGRVKGLKLFNFHILNRTDKTLISIGSSMSLLLAAANQTSEFASENPIVTGLGVIGAVLVPVLVTISKEYIQRRYPKVPTDQINESTNRIVDLLTLIQKNNMESNQQLYSLNGKVNVITNRIDKLEDEAKQKEAQDDAPHGE